MNNEINKEFINEKARFTKKALEIAEKNISKKEEAQKIIEMVRAYLKDSQYFLEKGDLLNSFGAIYYAHGWLDCGARLGIFNVKDNKIFTVE